MWRPPIRRRCHSVARAFVVVGLLLLATLPAAAQAPEPTDDSTEASRLVTGLQLLAGAAIGLGIHEGGHLTFNLLLDADPGIKRVSYAGVPFFAITHAPVSPREEFAISYAGFWAQQIGSEILLSRRPQLRKERAPIQKGILAFNTLVSVMYAGAALAQTGPPERDTRGIAVSARIGEPWVAPLVLGPAALDVVRYFRPESRTARWASRIMKAGTVILIVRAQRS